jgi:hypothetical protein
MDDFEKPRRDPDEERKEIQEVLGDANLQPSLSEELARLAQRDSDAMAERARRETVTERERGERLSREEAETEAERPMLHARQRRVQAAWSSLRSEDSWTGRQAS